MVNTIKVLVYVWVWLIGTQTIMAQALRVTISRDTLETPVGATFTNRLLLTNTSQVTQTVHLSVELPTSVQLLSSFPPTVVLLAGETILVPIKGLLNSQSDLPTYQLTVHVNDTTGLLIKSLAFTLITPEKHQAAISLLAASEPLILFSSTAPAHLPLRLRHNRSSRETYFIDMVSMPAGIDQTTQPIVVELAPRQDTSLALLAMPTRYWSASTPYELIITIRDGQKSVVGSVVYKLVVAVDTKRYAPTTLPGGSQYGVSAGLTKLSDNQWAREAHIWGSDSVGNAQVDVQLHYLDYVASSYRQLQNSFIAVHTERVMARLGSSYDFHELALVGRGLKIARYQPDYQWTVWAINTSPNWIDNQATGWTGNILSARYDRRLTTLPGGSWSVSSSYFTQSYTMRMGYLNFAAFQYKQPGRHSLDILVGQSAEFARQGTNRAATLGWAGQLSYSYLSPRLGWQLRTYVSSPVYAGMQKGATLINSQLIWQLAPTTTLIARLNHMYYKQTLFTSAIDAYHREFGTTVAEVSLSQKLRQFTVSIRPYWYAQTDFSVPSSQQATSFRLAPSFSYRRRAYQYIDISYDIGTFFDRTASPAQPGMLSQRMVTSAVMGPFSFWGYWQKGPYYLLDLQHQNPAQIMNASLTPMIDISLLKQRVMGSVGLNYIYDAFMHESRYMAVGRLTVDVTPTCSVRLAGYGTPYNQRPEQSFSQYRAELTKRFDQLKPGHQHRLQLHFFEDVNGNGSKESGEHWLDSLLVTVNDNTLLTNAKGSITYRHLPPGTYTISAVSASRLGDPILYQATLPVMASVDKVVALSRRFRVTGQLSCQQNAYERQPCQFNRFMIDVQRDQQTISSTSPLQDGTFTVHLPPGTYTVLVRDYGRTPQVTVKTTTFTLTETGQHPALTWTVDAATRPIDIKRFKSD